MTIINTLLQEGESLPLSISLQARHSFEATDPRDKLSALMEMSDPTSWGPVQIDYTEDVLPLYRKIARYIFIREQGLSLLHNAGIRSLKSLTDLPFWVPD